MQTLLGSTHLVSLQFMLNNGYLFIYSNPQHFILSAFLRIEQSELKFAKHFRAGSIGSSCLAVF